MNDDILDLLDTMNDQFDMEDDTYTDEYEQGVYTIVFK